MKKRIKIESLKDERKRKNMVDLEELEQELKEKLDFKIDKEMENFISDLEKRPVKEILDRSYEKTCKEAMAFTIKDKNYYDVNELKALLKKEDILAECYDEWIKNDGDLSESLEYSVNKRIHSITDRYRQERIQKNRESR